MIRPLHAALISLAAALGIAVVTLAADAAIRFAEPLHLWWMLAPMLFVALYTTYLVWRGAVAELIGHGPTVESMTASWSGRRHFARMALTALACVFLVFAAARPQWGEETREVSRKGIDVVFALDISRSMLADDVAPSRLDAAVGEMGRLMHLLEGDRVGLVVFAGISFVQSPLTSDYGAIRLYLDRLDPEDLPIQGTAIGRAITEGTKLLTGVEGTEFERAQSQLIIVFTDGEDHETEPVNAAAEAYANGIHVYTVGVGTPDGARIPIRNPDGSIREYLTDRQDQVVVTTLEEEQMIEVADAGGGEYVRFSTEGAAAAALEEAIAAYDDEALSSALRQEYQDRFMFFLVPGLILLLIASFIGNRRKSVGLVSALAVLLCLQAACGDALLRPDPRVERAMELNAEGEHAAALEELDRARLEAREQPEFHYDRGLIFEITEEYRDAQDEYLRALNAADEQAQVSALVALGNALLAQELYETAIERYRRALTLDPTHETARRNFEIAMLRLYPPCETLDDDFEDNEVWDQAATLPATVFQGEYMPPGVEPSPNSEEEPPSLVACPQDEDWYAIPVVGGATLDVEVVFERLRDDTGHAPPPELTPPMAVRIALIDVDGTTPLAVDQGLVDATVPMVAARRIERRLDEVEISPTVDANGLAFLKVDVDAPLEYEYSIEITLTPPCWALEDTYESNDRRTHAASMEENGPYQARICMSNDDWFSRPLSAGDNLFVDVIAPQRDDGTPGTIDARFYEGDGPAPVSTQRLTESMAAFSVRDVVGESSAALSISTVDETEGGYEFSVYHYPPCELGGNDRFEPNDLPNEAHQVNPEEEEPPFRHLRLCEMDQDWFAVPLPEVPEEDREDQPYRPFSALVEFEEPGRQVQVALYDPQTGQAIAVSEPVQAAPNSNFVDGAAPPNGVVAYARIPWETQGVIAVVLGQEPGFYTLSFPHTEEQQQEQQEQQEQEEQEQQEQEEQEQEEQEQEESESGEEEEQSEPEESEPEEDEESPADELTDEEEERELLLQLLDSLEPEDVNLPLQQALEAVPPVRLRDEW